MEQQIIANGGVQYVPQIPAAQQIVYLDFDGESTAYRNDNLDITIDVDVEDSGMSEEQEHYILAELSAKYALQDILFTIEKPEEDQEYSTIFIGQTDDFEEYGNFAGLAETIDKGNQIKNDNAFVFADFNTDIDTVISVIEHELGHIVLGEEHSLSINSLADYAYHVGFDFEGSSSDIDNYSTIVEVEKNQIVTITVNSVNITANQYMQGTWGHYVFKQYASPCLVVQVDGKKYFLADGDKCEITLNEPGSYRLSISTNHTDTFRSWMDTCVRGGLEFSFNLNYKWTTVDNKAPSINDFFSNAFYEKATISINAMDEHSKISKYYVSYSYVDSNGNLQKLSQQSRSSTITLTNLLPGTTYTYSVAAEDEYGNKSSYSDTKTFTTLTDTEAPVFTGGFSYDSTGDNLTLRWNAATDNASVAKYEINFNGTIYTSTTNALTLNISPGAYNYSVTAFDKSGNRSIAQSGTTKTYSISGNIVGNGTLTGIGTYFLGTPVTVVVTPDTHNLFVGLSVNGQNIAGNTVNIAGDQDSQVSAVFRPMEQYTVTAKSNFNDLNSYLTVTGTDKNAASGKYYETSSVTFTAGDKKGYKFDYWLINGTIYENQTITLNNITTNLNAEAVYSVYDINFNIPSRTKEDDFIIGNFASIPGMPTYSITLGSYYTKPGVYKLMSNAAEFNEEVQLFAGSTLLGTLLPNGTPLVNKEVVSRYLSLENGNLLLTIKDNLYVYQGESVYNHIISGPYHGIVSGSLTGVSVVSGGQLWVEGKVDTALVSSGTIYVNSGGSLTNTKINTNNFIAVYQGGEVANTTMESGGWLYIDGKASGTIINNAGGFSVNSTGQSDDTAVNNGGQMLVSSGGFAKNTQLYSGGSAYIYDSGYMEKTNIHSGGVAHVYNNGTLNSTTIHSGGHLSVYGNGSATSIRENGGYVHIDNGATVTFLSNTIENLNLYGFSATLHSNTVANNCQVNSNGELHIGGGIANNTTINSGGSVYIRSGGIANNTIVKTEKGIDLRQDYTNSSGVVCVEKDGIANNTTLNVHGEMYVSSGGRVNNTYVDFIGALVVSGGVACNTTIDNYGYFMLSGGIASNTILSAGGSMYISSGAIHKGMLQISAASHYPTLVSAYAGAIIDLTLDDRNTNDGYLINDLTCISGSPTYTITVSPYQKAGTYKLAQRAGNLNQTITIGNGVVTYGTVAVNGSKLEYDGVYYEIDLTSGGDLTLTVNGNTKPEPILSGTPSGVSFYNLLGEERLLEYSTDNFQTVLSVETSTDAADTYGLPKNTYQWRVTGGNAKHGQQKLQGEDILSSDCNPSKWISDTDNDFDLFFANANGMWTSGYAAQHTGILNGWSGTNEQIFLIGKNKLSDIFEGSDDANILVMTDDTNGDALFVDDIYTALPGTVAEQQARIAKIDEIRAGFGDDIIDMTSQRFAYIGDGVKIYGGLGNDTIWANNGNNTLWGDAGNDRIVGGAGNDVIVGGSGNDSMHGGSGDDIFCFGDKWGNDTVEQLTGGSVTLWFKDGSASNWNESTLTYTDGSNTVKVSGVDTVTLKFGADATLPDGALADAASEKIFEDKNSGMLA